jgi:methylase of polypeptide subunit release factors
MDLSILSQTKEKVFSLVRHQISLLVAENELFMPNQTTRLFTKAVDITEGDIVFDIGSGVGPLAIWAGYEPSLNVYGVEIVPEQCHVARENIRRHHLQDKVQVYEGSMFEPLPAEVKEEGADVIIADVSGISEQIARMLEWYPRRIPTGGRDGTEITKAVIDQARKYLRKGGRLYFPMAGLSNYMSIIEKAKSSYNSLIERINVNFPLSKKQVEGIADDADPGTYSLETKGSRSTWKGWIIEATSPI